MAEKHQSYRLYLSIYNLQELNSGHLTSEKAQEARWEDYKDLTDF